MDLVSLNVYEFLSQHVFLGTLVRSGILSMAVVVLCVWVLHVCAYLVLVGSRTEHWFLSCELLCSAWNITWVLWKGSQCSFVVVF